ncbi:cytochrome P450 [Crassisporium funariophilum]|nr:cytochrome P450 [Crassisporium funariophilum]
MLNGGSIEEDLSQYGTKVNSFTAPIVGNIFDIAQNNPLCINVWRSSDLVYLSTFGKNVLFVNTFQAAHELFEKRSANYSDRNAHWQPVAPTYWPVQRREAHALLRRLLHTPNDLVSHLRHNAAATIIGITYGITIAEKEDRYVAMAEKALQGLGKAAGPGAFLVDLLPILKHVPYALHVLEFLDGTLMGDLKKQYMGSWPVLQKESARLAQCRNGDDRGPLCHVSSALRGGKAVPWFVANLLTELDTKTNSDDEMETIKNCAGVAYAAGAESTLSTLTSFVLAIVTHPEVLAKAQDELDRVARRDRLPEFSDRQALPSINAILKETLRPVAPLGLAHMVTRDDEYNGYFIPAGTTVIGNSWGILHDPKTYPEPMRFNPDRFMGKGKGEGQHISPMDPLSPSFGYGRHACPGRHIAEAQVWISIACILSVFDISAPVDKKGTPIDIKPAFSSGMVW